MPSRSSQDPVADALEHAASQIVEAVRALRVPAPVVLVDGRSGAGKTTLARLVAERWPLPVEAQSIAMDSIYPGWDGLDAGTQRALDGILRPHLSGVVGAWRRWDWERETDAEAHQVDPSAAVILEGCGTLAPATAALAHVRVWMDAPDAARKERALTRDGDAYRPHWERWAAQEQLHIDRDDPRSLASIVVTIP